MSNVNIKFISDCVDGETPMDELELVCVPRKKHASVSLCFKAGMNIPFAEIKLFDTNLYVDAMKVFDCASALGEEITEAFNARHENTTLKARIAELESDRPKYKPGDVVWVLTWGDTKHGESIPIGLMPRNIGSIILYEKSRLYVLANGERWDERDLHPTREAAQASIDKRNGAAQ